jgi:hypothetical protein
MLGTSPAQIPGAKISACHSAAAACSSASGTIIMSNDPP